MCLCYLAPNGSEYLIRNNVEISDLAYFKAPSVQLHGESVKTMRIVGIVDSHVAVNPRRIPNINQTSQAITDLFSVGRVVGWVLEDRYSYPSI